MVLSRVALRMFVVASVTVGAGFSSFIFPSDVLAKPSPVPNCFIKKTVLPENNDQVVEWKKSSRDQYKSRGHVTGTLTNFFPNKNGHRHFEVTMNTTPPDVLEIVYNESFGQLPPSMNIGSKIEACGDYITSRVPTKIYPASPSGAILHWVHKSHSGHESGYVAVDGVAYGDAVQH